MNMLKPAIASLDQWQLNKAGFAGRAFAAKCIQSCGAAAALQDLKHSLGPLGATEICWYIPSEATGKCGRQESQLHMLFCMHTEFAVTT